MIFAAVKNSFLILSVLSLLWALLDTILPSGIPTIILHVVFIILTLMVGAMTQFTLEKYTYYEEHYKLTWIFPIIIILLTAGLLRFLLTRLFALF